MTKESLLAGLEAARQQLCAYMGDRCDCKFGIKPGDNRFEPIRTTSEQTGCPEIALAIEILKRGAEEIEVFYGSR